MLSTYSLACACVGGGFINSLRVALRTTVWPLQTTIGSDQGWEYLGTHPLGKSYLVVSYLGKDKSYLVSKPVVCKVVSPALTGKTYVSRILGRILVLPAQIPPVCGCAVCNELKRAAAELLLLGC